jgi:putative transposase
VTITLAEMEFSDKALADRWRNVREDFWGDLKAETVNMLKRLLERTMDIEIQDLVGARPWGRNRRIPWHRNGRYRRSLLTGFGLIPDLAVPRLREGRVPFRCLAAYRRRTQDVDAAVLKTFLAGVSERRVQEVLEPLLGPQVASATTVSKITRVLDKQVQRFHARPLQDVYRYLILDGVYLKAKSPLSVKRRCVLVAYGVRQDGLRELIDFHLAAHGESQTAWELFLTRLKNRGLEGRALRLAVVDGNQGLWNALDLVWLGLPRQRCWAHKLRNLANKLPRRFQTPCLAQARNVYNCRSYAQAVAAFRRWKRAWYPVAPDAVACLENDLDSLLTFYRTAPKTLWRKLRTTNVIERAFREVRRRTRPMSCFQNVQSVERILFALFFRQNTLWSKKPLPEITQNS